MFDPSPPNQAWIDFPFEVSWNPWRALLERARTIVEWQRLATRQGVVEVHDDGTEIIILDPRMLYPERRAVLGHELIHLERGLLPDGTPADIVAKEEHQVHGETARRLVPIEELAAFVSRCEFSPVTVDDVADEFEVPRHVAERALAQLRHPRSAAMRQPVVEPEEGAA